MPIFLTLSLISSFVQLHNKPLIITYHSDIVRQVILKVFYNHYCVLGVPLELSRLLQLLCNQQHIKKISKKVLPLGMRDVAQTAGNILTKQSRQLRDRIFYSLGNSAITKDLVL